MRPEISVITCSHNPKADYLQQVLDALEHQTVEHHRWEYLLIDNASEEPLSSRINLSWHPNSRHVREDRLGLTHARLRGIREAQGEVLVFVDDDNVLDSDYLEKAIEIAYEYPMLGAWSGQCKGKFEIPPEDWSRPYLGPLCVGEFDYDYWCNFPFRSPALPSGAGLCIRVAVASEYLRLHESGVRPFFLDRTGKSLASGGDIDMGLTCADIGLGMGIFHRLKLTHLISAFRLKEEYLLSLAESIAFSSVILDYYRPLAAGPTPKPWRTRIANLMRMILMTRRERRFFRVTQNGLANGRKALRNLRRPSTIERDLGLSENRVVLR